MLFLRVRLILLRRSNLPLALTHCIQKIINELSHPVSSDEQSSVQWRSAVREMALLASVVICASPGICQNGLRDAPFRQNLTKALL